MSEEKDKKYISDDVIAVCAVNATLKTKGVVRMAGGISDALSENILRKEIISKGTKVFQEKGRVEIDVFIIAEYGCKIPQVAWDIQENVQKEVESMTELEVSAVNIHVQGVEKNDEK